MLAFSNANYCFYFIVFIFFTTSSCEKGGSKFLY